MKYSRYLIAGIILVTVLLLFVFSGAFSENKTELFKSNGFDVAEDGYNILLLGIGLPLLLAIIFVFIRRKRDRNKSKM